MKTDEQIITALQDAADQGKLSVVAAVTGYGADELQKIMRGQKPLEIGHRITLAAYIEDVET